MTTQDESAPVARRLSMRRSRGGFSGGSSTQSESLRTSEADEVDDAIEPEQIHNRIVNEARRRPAPRPTPPQLNAPRYDPSAPVDADPRAPTPSQRMDQVASAGNASFAKEYRLNMLHRLLLRKVPLDQIAQQLGVSISTVQKDRVELKARLRQTARDMDINEIIGNQTGLYDEISGMALMVATNNQTPTAMRLAAMRTTLATEADRTRFLNTAGVFDVLRYRRSEEGSDLSDVQMLMGRTDEMLARIMDMDNQPDAPAPRTRRRNAPGGFAPMTMDDASASSGDAETVDI